MIAALLLAAGESRRFGAPKLLQDLDGKPVVRWSAEALGGPPVDEIIVVVPREHDGMRAALAGIPARFVVNEHAELGIGGSLARGVAAVAPNVDAVVVALADEPTVGRAGLLRVIQRHRAGGVSIVVPTYRGIRGHPVLFDRSVFAELRALSGDQGARAVTDRDLGRVAFVELREPKPIDIDTPADLSHLRSGRPKAASLLDELMPRFDVSAAYSSHVRATAAVVYHAVLETDLANSRLARILMVTRGLRGTAKTFRFEDLPPRGSFFTLGSAPPREVVAGVIGRFWTLRSGVIEGDRASFDAPLAPGTAKAAWGFRVDDAVGGSLLTTETRVLCADEDSRRRFRRYWILVGPFSGVIRREALRLIRAQAQFTSSSTTHP